jgi:hypothetical protein
MPKRKDTKATEPKVGIIYSVGAKLFLDSTPLSMAGRYGDHLIHEGDHISFWAELAKCGRVLKCEYEKFLRGRVAYNTKSGKFMLLADKCILDRMRIVLVRLQLPPKDTETGLDPHYRCFYRLAPNQYLVAFHKA